MSNMTEPQKSKKRFQEVNEDEVNRILNEKDAVNTTKSTEQSVRLFRHYLQEKGKDENFENYDSAELDNLLSKFYVEVRQENGELYKKSSMFSLHHGINRHLSKTRSDINILNDEQFKVSNTMFKAVNKELKRSGKGVVDHYPPIEKEDLSKLYQYFDLNDPKQLQEKVFVDVMLYFGRRGRENLRTLKVRDFACSSDGNGSMFIYIKTDELTKNHQDDNNSAEGRMYAIPDDINCSVKTFVRYKKHLNLKIPNLFQRPKSKISFSDKIWYDAAVVGHNTLGSMMPRISEAACLSKKYTNHSLRATSVHLLDAGNFASRHIMKVTGHKAESSLKTYSGHTDSKTKKAMSDHLSKNMRENVPPVSPNLPPKIPSTATPNIDDIFDEETDRILCSLDYSETLTMVEEGPQNQVNPNQMPQPIFNNCSNITINYNFK